MDLSEGSCAARLEQTGSDRVRDFEGRSGNCFHTIGVACDPRVDPVAYKVSETDGGKDSKRRKNYGNHDTETMSTLDKTELNEVYKSLSYKTSGNLLYPYVQPEIMGRNNQLIELRNADGSICTALFMIDSNAYTGEGLNVYDYIHDDQVDCLYVCPGKA